MHKGLFLRAALGMTLALSAACGDDDGDVSNEETPRTDAAVRDAATGVDSGTPADSSTPDAARTDAATANTIVDVAVADGRFTTLAGALTKVGLVATLQGPGPFTVFAPTDEAFAKLPPGTLDSLTNEQLTGILTYHAVSGRVLSTALTSGPVDTVAQLSAFVTVGSSGVTVNNAKVTTADVQASNGVIHVIDTVLLPPNVVQAAQYAGFTTLAGAIETAGLTEALSAPTGTFTVFAPTEAAFAKLPPGTVASLSPTALGDLLKYHVLGSKVLSTQLTAGPVNTLLSGKQVTISLTGPKVNDSNITLADVKTSNGIIHAIDTVLTVP
jgi:transforming growth factor-beta-induced protein